MQVTLESVLISAKRAMDMPVYPDAGFPPSEYYRFLQAICTRHKPGLCVELGTCGGGGSLHMCIGTPGRVVGVDIVNDYPEQIDYISNHFSNFEFLLMDSIEAVNHIDGTVDMLFIDTVHTYERTMLEYGAWVPRLSDVAIVCLDDLYRDGMDKVWEAMPSNKIRLDWLHHGGSPTDGGFGVVLHGL